MSHYEKCEKHKRNYILVCPECEFDRYLMQDNSKKSIRVEGVFETDLNYIEFIEKFREWISSEGVNFKGKISDASREDCLIEEEKEKEKRA